MDKHMDRNIINKIIAVLLMLAVVFVISYSVYYESTHYVHECSGSECPVCYELQVAGATISQIGAVTLTSISIFILIAVIKKIVIFFKCSFQERTLILDKVRLDN